VSPVKVTMSTLSESLEAVEGLAWGQGGHDDPGRVEVVPPGAKLLDLLVELVVVLSGFVEA
jgi:hypothetical protein